MTLLLTIVAFVVALAFIGGVGFVLGYLLGQRPGAEKKSLRSQFKSIVGTRGSVTSPSKIELQKRIEREMTS